MNRTSPAFSDRMFQYVGHGENKYTKKRKPENLTSLHRGAHSTQGSGQLLSARKASGQKDSVPLTRQQRVAAVKEKQYMDRMPVVTGNEALELCEGMENKAMGLATSNGLPVACSFVLAHIRFVQAIHSRADATFKAARSHCDDVLKQVEEGSLMHIKALVLHHRLNFLIHGCLDDQACRDFVWAYKQGEPEAAVFCMLAKSCRMSQHSTVKWADLTGVIDIARELPDLKDQMNEKLAVELVRARAVGDAPGILACQMLQAMADVFSLANHAQMQLGTIQWICDLFAEPEDKKEAIHKAVHQELREHEAQGVSIDVIQAIYYYACLIRYRNAVSLVGLVCIHTEPSYLLAANFMFQYPDIAKYFSEDNKYLPDLAPVDLLKKAKGIPAAYHLRIEILLRDRNFPGALKVALEGMMLIQDFFKGKKSLYGYRIGGQAAKLKSLKSGVVGVKELTVEELAAQIDLEEQCAANKLLRSFQVRAELFQEIIEIDKNREEEKKKAAEKRKGVVSIDAEVEALESGEDREFAGADLPGVASKIVPVTDCEQQVALPAGNGKKESCRSVLIHANDLMRSSSELDLAEEKILSLQPVRQTVDWFNRQQSLSWCYHEQGTAYDYLTGKVKQGGKTCESGLVKLKKSEKQAKDAIKELVKLAEQRNQELKCPEGISRLYSVQDQKKYMAVARELQNIQVSMRWVYGSLYSTLGHIQKAYRDNPCSRESSSYYLEQGGAYFQIANYIRGYSACPH